MTKMGYQSAFSLLFFIVLTTFSFYFQRTTIVFATLAILFIYLLIMFNSIIRFSAFGKVEKIPPSIEHDTICGIEKPSSVQVAQQPTLNSSKMLQPPPGVHSVLVIEPDRATQVQHLRLVPAYLYR
jgi:hypothetical protein